MDEGETGSEMGETGRSVEGGSGGTERMVETARCKSLLTRDGRLSWGGGWGGGQGKEDEVAPREAAGGLIKGDTGGSGGREG